MAAMCWYCMTETVKNGVCTVCHRSPSVQVEPGILPPGTELDNGSVWIGEKLGQGGFGVTYVAFDRQSGKRVALKEFRPNHMVTDERVNCALQVKQEKTEEYEKSRRSFMREARLLSKLNHPHIVPVYFTVEENNTCYYGMELLEGQDLKQYLLKNGVLRDRDACQIVRPIMDALEFVHSHKTLHRDISPANIFLRNDPSGPLGFDPCLIDFGAAFTAMDDFTHSVANVMTKGYSPLEQNMSVDYMGPYTDVYALCATLYHITTGKVPPPALDRHINNTELLPADKLNPSLSPAFSEVLTHGLALKWSDRIQNIPELRKELASVFPDLFSELPHEVHPKPEVEKPDDTTPPPPQPQPPKVGWFIRLCRRLRKLFSRKVEERNAPSASESVQPVPVAELYCREGCFRGLTLPLRDDMYFGRNSTSHVPINDSTVSGQHFRIFYRDGKVVLQDMRSTNGTFVNNIMLRPGGEKVLNNGDIIKVGQNNLFLFREENIVAPDNGAR